MGIAIVSMTYGSQRVETPVEQKHLWYDAEAEWMVELRGGMLTYAYREDGSQYVTVQPAVGVTYKSANNRSTVMDWYEANRLDLHLELLDGGTATVAFSFPDESEDDVDAGLSHHRFDYEIL